MDLGATICLARVPRCGACPLAATCPSRGSRYAPLRKQGRLEGSFRERRARTLRLVLGGAQELSELDSEAVAALAHDGLVCISGDVVGAP
jgi:A/G-specific adenine glycosylase